MDSYLIGLPVVSYRSLFINSLSLSLSSLSLSLSLRNIKYFYSITLFFLFFNLFFFSWRSLHLQINSAARPLIITHKTSAYIYLYDHCYHLIPQKLHILCSEKAQSCSGNLNTHVSKVNFHVDLWASQYAQCINWYKNKLWNVWKYWNHNSTCKPLL